MSEPRKEILRLLADGHISPMEADMLIDALEEGVLERSRGQNPGGGRLTTKPTKEASGRRVEAAADGNQRGKGQDRLDSMDDAGPAGTTEAPSRSRPPRAAKKGAVKMPKGTSRRTRSAEEQPSSGTRSKRSRKEDQPAEAAGSGEGPSGPHPRDRGTRAIPAMGTSDALTGLVWELPPGSTLRVGPPGAGSDALAGLGLRGVEGNRVRIYRGNGAELRAAEAGSYELIWREGLLIMDIPTNLGGLEISGIQGKVTLLNYGGPFAIDEVAGSLAVNPVRSPFRIRRVGGDVQLDALSLLGGLSTVAEIGSDVRIRATRDASFTVRASSLSGQVAFGRTIAVDSGDSRKRRGVWRLGTGAGQLNITGVKGWIRLFQDPDTTET